MSLLPIIFSNWWEGLEYPHHVPAQNFATGIHPERLQEVPTTSLNRFYNHPLQALRNYNYNYHPLSSMINQSAGEQRGLSVVKPGKDKFQVALDIQQFSPDEIKVKVIDKYVIVEGKHDEKQDEHGFVTRQFIRKYLVPEQCDIDKVSSSLSSDGILTLNAPRKHHPESADRQRIINIEHTGKPALLSSGKISDGDREIIGVKKTEEKGEDDGKSQDEMMMKNGDEAN